MLDGVVAQGRQGLAFRGAQVDEACVERVQALVRQLVLGLFERRRLLSRAAVAVMQGRGHSGGFSMRAGVRACGPQGRIVMGVSGCCDIVRVRCLPVSGCRGRRCTGTGLSSGNKDLLSCG